MRKREQLMTDERYKRAKEGGGGEDAVERKKRGDCERMREGRGGAQI